MNDVSTFVLLFCGLILFDILALSFGHDSRDVPSSQRTGPLRAAQLRGDCELHYPK